MTEPENTKYKSKSACWYSAGAFSSGARRLRIFAGKTGMHSQDRKPFSKNPSHSFEPAAAYLPTHPVAECTINRSFEPLATTSTGPAAVRRLPDAVHPGKTKKRRRRKLVFSLAVFVFTTPVDGFHALSMGLPSRKKRTANGRPYGVRSSC